MAAAEEEKMHIEDIKKDNELFNNYISFINSLFIFKKVSNTLTVYNEVIKKYNGLPNMDQIREYFEEKCINRQDKGTLGKMIEYILFNNLPNNSDNPDFNNLGDCKVTNFKLLKNNCLTAKERVTITNVGNANNYSSFTNIIDNEHLCNTKCSKKLNGILIVFKHNNIKWNNFEQCLQLKPLIIIPMKFNDLQNDLISDYQIIRNMIINNEKITQKGQNNLHIHKHGSKGSNTRALGLKNKYVTKIIANELAKINNVNIEEVLKTKGRSTFIDNKYLY